MRTKQLQILLVEKLYPDFREVLKEFGLGLASQPTPKLRHSRCVICETGWLGNGS